MNWHYTTTSGREGPVDKEKLKELIDSGVVDMETLVWKSGMSPDWVPITQCDELAGLITTDVPPPMSDKIMGNGFIWALSTAPFWGSFVQVLATEIRVAITNEAFVYYSEMWWVMLAINISLITADVNRLDKAGHNTDKIKWWMYLLVPVYIYQRDKIVKAGSVRFITWIVIMIVSLLMFNF